MDQLEVDLLRSHFPRLYARALQFLGDRGLRDHDEYADRAVRAYLKEVCRGGGTKQRLAAIRRERAELVFSRAAVTKAVLTKELLRELDHCLERAPAPIPPAALRSDSSPVVFSSGQGLFDSVVGLLGEFTSELESTGLWQPFWNEDPLTPKHEKSIQPVILALLRTKFRSSGIEIARETDEGIGLLDFRCVSTGKNTVYNTCVECKLAHHENIDAGAREQLPAYMDSVGTSFGVYLVLWFKDGKHWDRPTKYENPDELRTQLQALADQLPSKTIQTIVIDVTRKTPASRRR